jgi:hypothetical protein
MIIFTSDIDWTTEDVISEMIDVFEQYQMKCTFFATHDSKVLKNCNRDLFELAIHPNFNPHLENRTTKSVDDVIDELLKIYPEAKGVRSHCMTQSSIILGKFAEKGLLYDANHFLPYQKINVFKLWTGMWRIPYNWEDDIHYSYNKSFDDIGLTLNHDDLFVFDFHPTQVFLNTERAERYIKAKADYHDTEKFRKHRNETAIKGAKDALIYVFEMIKKHNFQQDNLLRYLQKEFLNK